MLSAVGTLVLWTALSGSPTGDAPVYGDYKEAWQAAQSANRPVLVILNPGVEADAPQVQLDEIRRSAHRRELLDNYVVAVIDTSTPEGQQVHKLFNSPKLPRVSVIDKQQKWQIYRTSQPLTAEDWNLVLAKYRTGQLPAVPRPSCNCQFSQR